MAAKSILPVVRSMHVIPVAGHDSMLMNLSGAHGPYFTRNLVILEDSDGRTGVGEVPGGEKIRQTLEDARVLVEGTHVGRHNRVMNEMRRRFADRDTGGRGEQTFDLRTTIHALTAVESRDAGPSGPAPGGRRGRPLGRRAPARSRRSPRLPLLRGRSHAHQPAVPRGTKRARRVDAAAAREGAGRQGRGAPRRGRARALRLQRLQAQGRRAARGRGGRSDPRAARALSARARDP